MNPPSKEQCAYVAGFLSEFGGSGWKRQAMEDVAKHLRSLHEECEVCGTVGGGGRVPCPLRDKCLVLVTGEYPESCPRDEAEWDDDQGLCLLPCPKCGVTP